jgi:hypothetical protein
MEDVRRRRCSGEWAHWGGRYTTARRKAARCLGRTTAQPTAEEEGRPGRRGGAMRWE